MRKHPDIVKSGKCEMASKLAPMGCAAAQGRTECLQALLDAGAPVDAEDGYGMTPLQVCHLFAGKFLAAEHRNRSSIPFPGTLEPSHHPNM